MTSQAGVEAQRSLTGQRGLAANLERLRWIRATFEGALLPALLVPLGRALAANRLLSAIPPLLPAVTTTLTTREGQLRITTPLLDAWPVFEVFAFHEYDFEMIPWQSVRTVIDCGAHVGSFALWAAGKADCRLVSVEPNPSVHSLLVRNVAALGSRIVVFRVAVAGQAGQRTLYDQGFAAASSFSRRSRHVKSFSVEAITLDALLDRSGFDTVDLLKMDVEGAEQEIFENVRPDTLARIRSVVIECHPFAGTKVAMLAEKLSDAGMQVAREPYLLTAWRPA